MRINLTRQLKAQFASILNMFRDSNPASQSIISSSHIEHVLGMGFLESKEWYQKFAQSSESISGKFRSIKSTPVIRFIINCKDTSEGNNNPIYKGFFDAMNLKFHHVAVVPIGSRVLSLTNKKAPISIDKTSQIDDIVTINSSCVDSRSSNTHNHLNLIFTTIVQNIGNKIHRDRLSEWTPFGDAIVGPA